MDFFFYNSLRDPICFKFALQIKFYIPALSNLYMHAFSPKGINKITSASSFSEVKQNPLKKLN